MKIFFLRSPKFGQKKRLNLSEHQSKSIGQDCLMLFPAPKTAPHQCIFLATRLFSAVIHETHLLKGFVYGLVKSTAPRITFKR